METKSSAGNRSLETKDTAQRTIPDHPDPSDKASSGAYIDFGQLHAPDDVTDVRSDYTPVGIAKAKRLGASRVQYLMQFYFVSLI